MRLGERSHHFGKPLERKKDHWLCVPTKSSHFPQLTDPQGLPRGQDSACKTRGHHHWCGLAAVCVLYLVPHIRLPYSKLLHSKVRHVGLLCGTQGLKIERRRAEPDFIGSPMAITRVSASLRHSKGQILSCRVCGRPSTIDRTAQQLSHRVTKCHS